MHEKLDATGDFPTELHFALLDTVFVLNKLSLGNRQLHLISHASNLWPARSKIRCADLDADWLLRQVQWSSPAPCGTVSTTSQDMEESNQNMLKSIKNSSKPSPNHP
jgi:hypothetical protein